MSSHKLVLLTSNLTCRGSSGKTPIVPHIFSFQCDSARIDVAEVWSRVQSVVQMLLTDYLDFKSKNVIHQQSTSTQVKKIKVLNGLATVP
jgi:hypothetical protein